jgi:hypothetical protein
MKRASTAAVRRHRRVDSGLWSVRAGAGGPVADGAHALPLGAIPALRRIPVQRFAPAATYDRERMA